MAHILVIDDEVNMCKSIYRILSFEGYDVVTADDGSNGIKMMQEKEADLVISDIVMPNKDGISTICELRSRFPKVKILAISGSASARPVNLLHLALEAGADSILEKPFSAEQLLRTIQDLI